VCTPNGWQYTGEWLAFIKALTCSFVLLSSPAYVRAKVHQRRTELVSVNERKHEMFFHIASEVIEIVARLIQEEGRY
jgi:hypothetical protein